MSITNLKKHDDAPEMKRRDVPTRFFYREVAKDAETVFVVKLRMVAL
jgi:hypothetical protein